MGGTVTQLLNLQGMLFILIIAGMVAGKKKLVSAEGRRCLTNVVLYVILPCNIVNSFVMPFSIQLLLDFLTILLIAAGLQIFAVILSKFLFNRLDEDTKVIFSICHCLLQLQLYGLPHSGKYLWRRGAFLYGHLSHSAADCDVVRGNFFFLESP